MGHVPKRTVWSEMMTKRWFLSGFATIVLAGSAHAGTISVFNTGVDSSGTPLSDGTIGDPHYLLTLVPGGSTTDIRVRTSPGGFPIGPWLGDDSISAWIGPNNDGAVDGPVGNYDYQTTFNLTGFDPATALITGQWATDNPGLDILINGVSTGSTSCCFTSWTGFSIGSGFIAGVNTLDFILQNQGGPTGLRVEMSGTAVDPPGIPEPASLVLLGGGFAALTMFRRLARR